MSDKPTIPEWLAADKRRSITVTAADMDGFIRFRVTGHHPTFNGWITDWMVSVADYDRDPHWTILEVIRLATRGAEKAAERAAAEGD